MIALIGSGNVAHWVAGRLKGSQEFPVGQVYSRRMENARALADTLGAEAIDDLSLLRPDSDIYLFSVKDDAYGEILEKVPFTMPVALHTAGSVSQNLFAGHAREYGVLYPLQTFSKTTDLGHLQVPLCVEESMIGRNRDKVHRLASELSGTCYAVDESRRAVLHLAAVFACNFGNAMNHIADDILKAEGMDLKMLLPLLQESLRKLQTLSPAEAQTGPAVRGDRTVMEKHIAMLEDDRLKKIYREVSRYVEEHKPAQVDS
ncbi:MAG: DUF2520 domain-containing protein [Bacteroidales bacterium]|nr:DUF2520 domain-containing protein [Bacteroidales bacterium]